VPVGAAPTFLGFAGYLYLATALIGGGFMVWGAWQVMRNVEGGPERKAAGQLFGVSITYLFVLFAVLLVEQTVLVRLW
ncbi:MAG: protoheme IX farnesyltransferase, partial [Alphaproteobacteria bacterium]